MCGGEDAASVGKNKGGRTHMCLLVRCLLRDCCQSIKILSVTLTSEPHSFVLSRSVTGIF